MDHLPHAFSLSQLQQYIALPTIRIALFEFITNVTFYTLNNTSACDDPYDDFTSQVAYLQPGQTYVATVTKSDIIQNYLCSIFIDWNQNLAFDVTEEYPGTLNGTSEYTFTITPPITATLGSTRMRVRLVQTAQPLPCGDETRGDVEDYTVNLDPNNPQPPINDGCSNAIDLTPGSGCENYGGSTHGSTESFPALPCDGNTAAVANDNWYSFTANGTSDYDINVTGTGGFNPVLGLYTGCNAGNNLACTDLTLVNGTETITTGILAAGVYYYRVYGNGGDGTYLTCVVDLAPNAGDACDDALFLPNANLYCSDDAQYSNIGAPLSDHIAANCWANTTNDVWFSFTATDPQLEVTVFGQGFGTNTLTNPQIAVYSGVCGAGLGTTTEGCAISQVGSHQSLLNIGGLIVGNDYFIRVDGDAGATGTFQICVNSYTAPVVTGQDCPDAAKLCTKDDVVETSIVGFGNDGSEAANSCLAAGANGGGLTEQNSAWYTWVAADNGPCYF